MYRDFWFCHHASTSLCFGSFLFLKVSLPQFLDFKKNTWLLKAMKINFVLHVLSGFPVLYASELAPGFCTSVLCI